MQGQIIHPFIMFLTGHRECVFNGSVFLNRQVICIKFQVGSFERSVFVMDMFSVSWQKHYLHHSKINKKLHHLYQWILFYTLISILVKVEF